MTADYGDVEFPIAGLRSIVGFKRLAVLYLNTDWGRQSQKIFSEAAKADGLEIVASEAYQPDEKDFRSTLVRVRDAKPDAIVLISYYADGALITRQIRTVGLSTPIVASGSIYSPKFIELAGDAAVQAVEHGREYDGRHRQLHPPFGGQANCR